MTVGKNGTLPETWSYIPAKITDNVDKNGNLNLPQAYIDNLKNLPKFEYMVFVEGNWDIQLKTGGEFLRSFELSKHVKPIKFEPEKNYSYFNRLKCLPLYCYFCFPIN